MRRKDREITDNSEIEKIIGKAICCRIGLVDNDEPYIVPVCFGYERNTIYFHSALEGRKVELIKKNNKVCFEIDTDLEILKAEKCCDSSMRYRSVMGTGRAHVLESDRDKAHGLELIARQYAGDDFTIPDPISNSVLVIRIDVESMTGKQSGY